MTHKLTITVFYGPDGKCWVSQNSHLPLADRPVLPAIECFDTPDEAQARARQLQAEAGGPDVARIVEHPARLDQIRSLFRAFLTV